MVKIKDCKNAEIIFYAPNIHTGGGLVLMKELLEAFPKETTFLSILDERARVEIETLSLYNLEVISYVQSGFLQKIVAEWKLWRASKNKLAVISFHNIPPLFCRSKKVFVFFQNRLLVERNLTGLVSLKRRTLIYLERLITAYAYRSSMIYITQTETMKNLVCNFLAKKVYAKNDVNVIALPFHNRKINGFKNGSVEKNWDFLYVSSSEPYKNHRNLYVAWALLSQDGLFPTLAVTVSDRDFKLVDVIKDEMGVLELHIINIGNMSHSEVMECYSKTNAFIFPSVCESLSQPLIEANSYDLPIIASEADFVRDVCIPVETFDPSSPLSIARSVKRYLGANPPLIDIQHPNFFWEHIFQSIDS
jgi:glycosyltransferase involved in cell wall biosynthesis